MGILAVPLYNELKDKVAKGDIPSVELMKSRFIGLRDNKESCQKFYEIISVIILVYYYNRHPQASDRELTRIFNCISAPNGTKFKYDDLPPKLLDLLRALSDFID